MSFSAGLHSSAAQGGLSPGEPLGACILLCLHANTCKGVERLWGIGGTARGTLVRAENSYVLLLSFFLNKGKPNISQGFLIIIIFIFIPAPHHIPFTAVPTGSLSCHCLLTLAVWMEEKNFRYCPSYSDGCHRCLLPHLPQES